MPSNFTENYQLSQWEADDQVSRLDFNADNAKIDAALVAMDAAKGNCKIITGTYVGTGGQGKDKPNTLTLPKRPLVLLVFQYAPIIFVYPATIAVRPGNPSAAYFVSWSGNTVSWYLNSSPYTPENQLNEAGTTYHYIALVEA